MNRSGNRLTAWNSRNRALGWYRKAIGLGLPAVIALGILGAVACSGNDSGPSGTGAPDADPTESRPTATARIIQPTVESEPTTESPAEADSPDPIEYTVQPGDSLAAICAEQLPEVPGDDCLETAVAANGLAGPDHIEIGQVLMLGGDGTAPGSQPQPGPSDSAPEIPTTPEQPAPTEPAAEPTTSIPPILPPVESGPAP